MSDATMEPADGALAEARAVLERLARAGAPTRRAAPPTSAGNPALESQPGAGAAVAAARAWGEATLRGLLEALPDALLVIDQAGAVLLANGQAEALFGYRRDELLGRPVELLVPERF